LCWIRWAGAACETALPLACCISYAPGDILERCSHVAFHIRVLNKIFSMYDIGASSCHCLGCLKLTGFGVFLCMCVNLNAYHVLEEQRQKQTVAGHDAYHHSTLLPLSLSLSLFWWRGKKDIILTQNRSTQSASN
jgi:hypothetical protein